VGFIIKRRMCRSVSDFPSNTEWCKSSNPHHSMHYSYNLDEVHHHWFSIQCALIINANSLSNGWYGVALQIEDFASTTSTTPLSSIPLQFLVNVFDSSASCASRPQLVGVTPPDGSCYPVASGSTWTARIVAQSGSSSVRSVFDSVEDRHNNNLLLWHILIASQTLSQHLQLVLPNQPYALALGQTSGTLT
jgi:hypothetical protein